MRSLLLALPFALAPLVLQADTRHAHASLASHQHGAAELDVAVDGRDLLLEWRSPAANLLGFEHAPRSAVQRQRVTEVRAALGEGERLFGLPAAAACSLAETHLDGALLATAEEPHDHDHDHDQAGAAHSDVKAAYRFVCAQPERLDALELAGLFARFPATETLRVQLIGPSGQRGAELSAAASRLAF